MDDVVQAVIDRVTEAAARHDATQEDRLNRWRVLSFETDPDAQRDAERTVAEAGLADYVDLRLEDGGKGLAALGRDRPAARASRAGPQCRHDARRRQG